MAPELVPFQNLVGSTSHESREFIVFKKLRLTGRTSYLRGGRLCVEPQGDH